MAIDDPNDLTAQFLGQQAGVQPSPITGMGSRFWKPPPGPTTTNTPPVYLSDVNQGSRFWKPPPPAIQMATQEISAPLDASAEGSEGATFARPKASEGATLGVPPLASTTNVPASTTSLIDPTARVMLATNAEAGQQAVEDQQTAQAKMGAAEQGVNEAGAEASEQEGSELAGLARQSQGSSDEAQKMIADRIAKQDAFAAQLLQQKVDPNRWWSSKSPLEKIGLTLGKILFSGGKLDSVLGAKSVNDAIDKDIAAQRQELETGQQGWQNGENTLARVFQATGDKREAEAHTRALLLQSTQKQLEALKARAQNPVVNAKVDAMVATLKEHGVELARKDVEDYIRTNKYQPAYTATTGAGQPFKIPEGQEIFQVGDKQVLIPKEAAEKEREKQSTNLALADHIQEAIKTLTESPTASSVGVPGTSVGTLEYHRLKQLQGLIEDASKDKNVPLRGEGAEILKDVAAGLTSPLESNASKLDRLNRLARIHKDEVAKDLRAQGYPVVRATPVAGTNQLAGGYTGERLQPAKPRTGAAPAGFTPVTPP
jgi:hypothetical protein